MLQYDHAARESSVGCCQVIEASPTGMPTVYTLLQRSYYKWSTNWVSETLSLISIRQYMRKHLKPSRRTQTFLTIGRHDGGISHFFVPLWPQSANDLETLVLQMC